MPDTVTKKLLAHIVYTSIISSLIGCETRFEQQPHPIYAFTQDAQEWRIAGNGADMLPHYRPTGGNPGGYVYAIDNAVDAWYFLAPEPVIKQLNSSYGQVLSFDLKQSMTDAQYDAADLILRSGESQLSLKLNYHPGVNWTRYNIRLNEQLPWRNSKGQLIDKQQFQQMLAGLDNLLIRGEYRYGIDEGGLDNLVIR